MMLKFKAGDLVVFDDEKGQPYVDEKYKDIGLLILSSQPGKYIASDDDTTYTLLFGETTVEWWSGHVHKNYKLLSRNS